MASIFPISIFPDTIFPSKIFLHETATPANIFNDFEYPINAEIYQNRKASTLYQVSGSSKLFQFIPGSDRYSVKTTASIFEITTSAVTYQ